MSDLISRGKLFNLLAPVQTLGEAYGIIQGMDTVDSVPVVRCNECQYFRTHDKNVGFCMKSHCLKRINGYCDDGEQKDGNDD